MYIFQAQRRDNDWYPITDHGKPVQAETISELVDIILKAEFNPQEFRHTRVIKRTEIAPEISYKDEIV